MSSMWLAARYWDSWCHISTGEDIILLCWTTAAMSHTKILHLADLAEVALLDIQEQEMKRKDMLRPIDSIYNIYICPILSSGLSAVQTVVQLVLLYEQGDECRQDRKAKNNCPDTAQGANVRLDDTTFPVWG